MTARTAPDPAVRPPSPRVRPATPDDASALAAFAAHLFTQTYARGGDGPVAASDPADVAAHVVGHFAPDRQRAELADAGVVTFVAECAECECAAGAQQTPNEVPPRACPSAWAGYAQLRLRPSAAAPTPGACAGPHPRELARLYVAPAWQGRGVADRLVDAVQARAASEPGGADPLWLAVYQANARAVAFYRRRGFTIAGDARFVMGHETQHDWLMTWRPQPPTPSLAR